MRAGLTVGMEKSGPGLFVIIASAAVSLPCVSGLAVSGAFPSMHTPFSPNGILAFCVVWASLLLLARSVFAALTPPESELPASSLCSPDLFPSIFDAAPASRQAVEILVPACRLQPDSVVLVRLGRRPGPGSFIEMEFVPSPTPSARAALESFLASASPAWTALPSPSKAAWKVESENPATMARRLACELCGVHPSHPLEFYGSPPPTC